MNFLTSFIKKKEKFFFEAHLQMCFFVFVKYSLQDQKKTFIFYLKNFVNSIVIKLLLVILLL